MAGQFLFAAGVRLRELLVIDASDPLHLFPLDELKLPSLEVLE